MTDLTKLAVDFEIQDGEWAPYLDVPFKHGLIERVGNLPNGTTNGQPAFQVLARLDDGSQVVVETTWAAMESALLGMAAYQEGQQ